jgi:hypothetical protein
MKKYVFVGMILTALALLFFLPLMPKSEADSGPPSFTGTAKAGRTVSACKQPGSFPCYQTTALDDDTYYFKHNIEQGTYMLADGCQSYQATYNDTTVVVNFCVPDPPLLECLCW